MSANIQLHHYRQALFTDFYQLTMAHGYWRSGMEDVEAVFHLFFRRRPFNGAFTVTAGLEQVVDFIENFQYEESDFAYLSTLIGNDGKPLFESRFFDYLRSFKMKCDIDAVPEGNIVFPYEPLLRVTGPLIHCQLLESPLLNLINFPTLIATKAARICIAAQDDSVVEFGLRRAQGFDGALTASRAAYIGGCEATSNVLAGKCFGIPVRGTHAHSWIQAFEDEKEAFEVYAKTSGNNCFFLVDTYNSVEGIKKAISVGKVLQEQGKSFAGIRLDSGDLAYLSILGRQMLDDAGFPETKILASNELDEIIISELKRQGAKVDIWGVGTHLVTGKDQAALDGVYKLSAVRYPNTEWRYCLKLSEQLFKVSNPGILQVRRFYDEKQNVGDVIYDINTDLSKGCITVDPLDITRQKKFGASWKYKDLLIPIIREGKRIIDLPSLNDIRETTKCELNRFHAGMKRFLNPHPYIVGMEKSLNEMKIELIHQARKIDETFTF